jgi:hypothetical protein
MLCRGIASELFDLIGEVCALVAGGFRHLLERPRLFAAVGENLQELGDRLCSAGRSCVSLGLGDDAAQLGNDINPAI